MSYVEIYAVRPNGDVELYDEVHNAHGGAMRIWRALGDDYGNPFPMWNDEPWWKWASNACRAGVISDDDALVYLISCDWGITPGELIPKAADALEAFYARHPHPTGDGIVAVLRRMAADPDVTGVCFNHTSVVADPLWKPWDYQADQPVTYNINTNEGHWWIVYPCRMTDPR